MTAKLAGGLPDIVTTNVCLVNISNRNDIERSTLQPKRNALTNWAI